MPVTRASRRPSVAARRVGYVIAVLVNAALLVFLHVWPGWEAVPFLTDDMREVLGIVDVSIVVGIVVNVVYLVGDPPWLTAVGGIATTAVGLVVLIRLLQVFPFDLGSGWATVLRVLLVVGIVGSVIGLIASLVTLVRLGTGPRPSG